MNRQSGPTLRAHNPATLAPSMAKFAPKPLLSITVLCFAFVAATAQPSDRPDFSTPHSDIPVHDPVMAKEGDTYYLFCTGRGVGVWSSPDLKEWVRLDSVFSEPPLWAVEAVPTFRGHIWAPDIYQHDGTYYLYYSISAFGKNTSCIGVATNTTLDPKNPDFKWIDHGKVIESFPGLTNWNAIDPNIIEDHDGTPYMSFGSFWGGLKLVELKPDRISLAEDWEDLPTIASRKTDPDGLNPPAPGNNPIDAGGNAIEAPFIFRHGDYYYQFASIDYCCRGANSTYKMIVGRSKSVKGPYLDREGKRLDNGGGTIILRGDENWHGVGHNSAYTFDGTDYLIYHAYDASHERGLAKLRINEIDWTDDDWPTVGKLVTPEKSPDE